MVIITIELSAKDLRPLGIDVVGDKIILSPARVAALTESENRAGIGVVGRGDAPA